MDVGFMHEAQTPFNKQHVAALADILGAGRFCRYVLRWDDTTNPRRGVFNFDAALRNLDVLANNGFDAYLNPQWAPAWVTDGQPTFVEYMNGSSWYSEDRAICGICGHAGISHRDALRPDNGDDIATRCIECTFPSTPEFLNDQPYHTYLNIPPRTMAFAGWREWARHPRRPSAGLADDWFTVVAKTFGPRIKYASPMNEPGGWSYNPPMSISQDEGMLRMFDDFYVPFVTAFRAYAPHVKLVGIEAQGGDEIRRMKVLERGLVGSPSTLIASMWDEYGIHYPTEAHAWDEYVKSCQGEPATDMRPIGVTEGGYDTWSMTREEIAEALRRGCSRYVVFKAKEWLLDSDGKPNANARELQQITGIGGGSSGANNPASSEAINAAFRELWKFGYDKSDYKDHGVSLNTSTPGSMMLMLAASIHDGANVPPSMNLIKQLAARIDERQKHPVLGEVKES